MKNTPLVSIGVAVFNGSDTLKRCLDSIVNQTYKNLEIIIVDDCSSDGSFNICKDYNLLDRRIVLKKNKINKGIIQNFNDLFNYSTGEYFLWADQDDIRDLSYLENIIKIMEKDKSIALCHSNTAVFFGTTDNVMHINTMQQVSNKDSLYRRYWNLLWHYNDTHVCGVFRTSLLKKTKLWKKINGSSNCLIFNTAFLGKIANINKTLFYYSGKAIFKRTNMKKELKAQTKITAPKIYYPGLILFNNQINDIIFSKLSIKDKLILIFFTLFNFISINFAKIIFRFFYSFYGNSIPKFIIYICRILYPVPKDINYVIKPENNLDYYPALYKYYPLIKL